MDFGGPGRDSDGDAANAGHLRCSGAAGIPQSMGDEGTVDDTERGTELTEWWRYFR